jgi:K+-sensing histidine kinase KdpD
LSGHTHVTFDEPFYRSAQTRRRGIASVGLGLAVVERIAVAFGGSVTVRSEPGSGCRFEVRLVATEPPLGSADDLKGETLVADERQIRGN